MVSVIASSIRKGNVVEKDGKLYVVIRGREHPSRQGHADYPSGNAPHLRWRQDQRATARPPTASKRHSSTKATYTYLYQDGDSFVFMQPKTFDQVHVSADVVGDAAPYLTENMQVRWRPVQWPCPISVEMPPARDFGGGGDRTGREGPDGVRLLQAGGSVERGADNGAATYHRGHACRRSDGGRRLSRTRKINDLSFPAERSFPPRFRGRGTAAQQRWRGPVRFRASNIAPHRPSPAERSEGKDWQQCP